MLLGVFSGLLGSRWPTLRVRPSISKRLIINVRL